MKRCDGWRRGDYAGVVACFDADCRCDPGLLVEMENLFRKRPEMPGCSVRFEHPLDAENSEAIILYELHLRYYIEACRYSGHPFAFHAVGSSMAVRAEAYVAQGGMNQRQAGEDFYFLQKIISLGNFGELNSTRVIPSPRVSDRVPFGPGRAVGEFLQGKGGRMESYPFEAFEDLKIFFGQICEKNDTVEGGLAEPLQGSSVGLGLQKRCETFVRRRPAMSHSANGSFAGSMPSS